MHDKTPSSEDAVVYICMRPSLSSRLPVEADRLIEQVGAVFSKGTTNSRYLILEDVNVTESDFPWLKSVGKLIRK